MREGLPDACLAPLRLPSVYSCATAALFPLPKRLLHPGRASLLLYLFPTPPHHSSPPPLLARLFTAAVVHRDVPHLCGNLLSAAPACLSRERHLGSSLRMATELVTLTALSHGLCVGWAVFQRRCMDRPQLYFRTGCVGLSAVVYAVQVRM